MISQPLVIDTLIDPILKERKSELEICLNILEERSVAIQKDDVILVGLLEDFVIKYTVNEELQNAKAQCEKYNK